MENNQFKINPDFNDLDNPESFINHIDELKKSAVTSPHDGILQKLIEQFVPLDFNRLANPDDIPDFTINSKHFRIIAINNVSDVAIQNNWGLCKRYDFIYLFNGAYWSEIDKDEFQKFLGDAAEAMGVRWDYSKDYNFKKQLYEQFLSEGFLKTPPENMNQVLINFLNGTFEVTRQGNKLRPFNRTDFLTYQLPFNFDPKATAPLFMTYLNKVQPDIERQRVLQEYLGYLFIRNGSNQLKMEKALLLYGSGANGKSVFFLIVTALLGRVNVCNFTLQNLTEEKGFYRAKLPNYLVNYASEINGKLETSIFKAMVSGEPIEACLKYGQPFTMVDYAKFIFNCNELPSNVEQTNAFFRRFLIIPFDVTIPDDEQDKDLHTKIIKNELSGIFNWVMEGLTRLLDQGNFSKCDAAEKALQQYRTESNSVKMFLLENDYRSSQTKHQYLKELYHQYKTFCIDEGMHPYRKNNFAKQLRNEGINVDRGTGNKTIVYIESDSNNDLPY